MGSAAKFGMLVLMAMVIALARFLEGEVKPRRPVRVTKSEVAAPEANTNKQQNNSSRTQQRLVEELPTVHVRPAPNTNPPAIKPAPVPAPKPTGRTYTVKKNDTLGRVSKRCYGTTRHWKHILKANHATLKGNERRLKPGMVLNIPAKP